MSNNSIVFETKNAPEILESYNPMHNYYYLFRSILKIQCSYRQFSSYKKLKVLKSSSSNKHLPRQKLQSKTSSCFSFQTNSITSNTIINPSKIKGNRHQKKGKYKYKGSFLSDKKTKNNFGIITWLDGSTLNAKFNHNKVSGFAEFKDVPSNSFFQGHYISNHPDGYGVLIEKGGEVSYEGMWNNNKLNGIGTEIWKDETFYRGEYFENKKQGIGLYKWPDGTIYQGEWDNDQMTGYGIIIYLDDRMYHGQVENGLMNGYGEFTWPDGKKYIGYYVNNTKEGFGIFIWSIKNLQAFVGFWVDGKMEGPGMKINDSGIKYGLWKNGNKKRWLQGAWEMKECEMNEKLSHFSVGEIKLFEKDENYIKNFLLQKYMNK